MNNKTSHQQENDNTENNRLSSESEHIQNMLSRAESLIHENKLEEVEKLLSGMVDESRSEFWYLKGLLLQKTQNWGDAMNCFNRCLEMDPEHTKSAAGVEMCQSILNFWNPSLFNP
jgi:hypothetical protein